MPDINYILLPVADPLASADLYGDLLGAEPVERAPGFVLYVQSNGLKLGLWKKTEMRPTPGSPGGVEISFSLPDRAAVDRAYADWTSHGLEVLQQPTDMDFGYTFVVADPDGHRLRPFALNENPR
jgi:catechol 2,3-dioxygenase-like lactoylglutathione lyase family enzyme